MNELKKELKNKDDSYLVEMTLLGSDKAYEELVIRHENAVKGTAYKVTGNEFSAEDASQDAFVSAWINLDSLKDRNKFGSWVCSIAKNCARNIVVHYKNTAPDISLNLLENMDVTGNDESGLWDEMSASWMNEQERDEKLRDAVEALSEKIREAVKLHYFDGLSVDEIAKKLSLPAGTVKWRLSEGRKQLRKEYGIMDKVYDEKETLVSRVMRQVEELKLWRLKTNKMGFEEDYRKVLSAVESLDESVKKHSALADVLLHGYWWLPGEANDEIFQKIKESAEKSHNDDVMQEIVRGEREKLKGEERIEFTLNTQIPYLEKHGFQKTIGYLWFWLGYEYFDLKQPDKGFDAYNKVLEVLKPSDVYYANALSAIELEKKRAEIQTETGSFSASGEVYRYIGNKLYFWEQPGYITSSLEVNADLFWNCSACDSLIYDTDMKIGEKIISSDGKSYLTRKADKITVTVPAGTFKNCSVFEYCGEHYGITYSESWFCPGVGLVRQRVNGYAQKCEWQLSDYYICGGEGLLPFAAGNRWSYSMVTEDGIIYDFENVFEMTAADRLHAVTSAHHFGTIKGYDEDTWSGNIISAKHNYYKKDGDKECLVKVDDQLRRAAELAKTKRQKLHTDIATDVMNRIFETSPQIYPDCIKIGRWNFFDIHKINKSGNIVGINYCSYMYHFEWKDTRYCGDESYTMLQNSLYDILSDAAGCIWSDEWKPGYKYESDQTKSGNTKHLTLEVLPDETVETPSGTFEGCRHISFNYSGLNRWVAYRGGKKEFWFAPGVGIVKMRALHKNDTRECIWVLTEYKGVGEGFFPTEDGLFRKYDPTEIGDGYHASVEYTFDLEDDDLIIFRNALGTQDRENYEAAKAKAEAEKASKQIGK